MDDDNLLIALYKAYPEMAPKPAFPQAEVVEIVQIEPIKKKLPVRDTIWKHVPPPYLEKRFPATTGRDVLRAAAAAAGPSITMAILRSPDRRRVVSHWRHIGFYIARHHTLLSYPQIGRVFGGRDHSTVLYGHKKVQANPEIYASGIKAVEALL